jgi:pilus assembly protein CpaC
LRKEHLAIWGRTVTALSNNATHKLAHLLITVFLVGLPMPAPGAGAASSAPTTGPAAENSSNDLSVVVGKSVVVKTEEPIERVSVGFGDVAEAMAVSPHEVLVNGKAPGSTSMIVWQRGGSTFFLDVNVKPNQFLINNRLATVRNEIGKELPGQNITITSENDTIFLRGSAKDLLSVQRATAIAATSGRVLNLMYVDVPAPQPQILLKVRFASLDRTKVTELGMNLFSTGATNTIGAISTQQFTAPSLPATPQANDLLAPFTLSNLLNVFLFRKDLNLGAAIQALETKGVLQVLAEPNLLAENGKQASFLAGGEIPYPVVQSTSGGTGAIIPTVAPNGMIRLQVAPEVSSLDYADGLQIQGYTVPALTSRKMQSTVELQDGQSFAISGLLDKRVTETYNKVPFMGDIPILGKMFQSKSVNRQNTELIVLVTPELVQPMQPNTPRPEIEFPKPFLDPDSKTEMRTPGVAVTGPTTASAARKQIPIETLLESLRPEKPLVINNGSSTANGSSPAGTPIDQPDAGVNPAPSAVTPPTPQP